MPLSLSYAPADLQLFSKGKQRRGSQTAATRLAAAKVRASLVEAATGITPKTKKRGRRHSAVVASGMERWAAFETMNAAEQARKEQEKKEAKAKRQPKCVRGTCTHYIVHITPA